MSHDFCKCLLKAARKDLSKKHGHIKLHTIKMNFGGGDPDYDVMLRIHDHNNKFVRETSIWYGTACCSWLAKYEALRDYEEILEEL